MTAKESEVSDKAVKVSRRRFVSSVGAGVVLTAVAVAGAESILQSKSAPRVVTSTVPGPTSTVAGPTTTIPGGTITAQGPTSTVPGPTTTVAGPTSTVTSTEPGSTSTTTNTVPGPTTTVAGPTTTVAGPTSTVTSTVTTTAAGQGFPVVKITTVDQVAAASQGLPFKYPLADEPNLVAKLGQKAQGGVGPDGDIVAFSMICQHAGCQAQYASSYASAPGPVVICPCHGSIYDLVNGAKVISGPAPLPLPQVMLGVDSSGDIYAYAMSPPVIYGHGSGDDVSEDLQG